MHRLPRSFVLLGGGRGQGRRNDVVPWSCLLSLSGGGCGVRPRRIFLDLARATRNWAVRLKAHSGRRVWLETKAQAVLAPAPGTFAEVGEQAILLGLQEHPLRHSAVACLGDILKILALDPPDGFRLAEGGSPTDILLRRPSKKRHSVVWERPCGVQRKALFPSRHARQETVLQQAWSRGCTGQAGFKTGGREFESARPPIGGRRSQAQRGKWQASGKKNTRRCPEQSTGRPRQTTR